MADMYFRQNGNDMDVHDGTTWRRLVKFQPKRGMFQAFDARIAAPDRATAPLLPEAQWVDVDKSRFLVGIKDQGQLGSCLTQAVTGSLEDLRAMIGLKRIRLCAEQLYGRVAPYPRDQGSTFEECLSEITLHGSVPESVVPAGVWNPGKYPSGWEQIALSYRAMEIYDCPTGAHLASACQLGFTCVLGVSVNDAFKPDANGVIHPYQPGNPNHGVRECGMRKIGGLWYFDMVNSWGTRWGMNGRALFPVKSLCTDVQAWAIRSPISPADDAMFS